jgi:hypothetical protein
MVLLIFQHNTRYASNSKLKQQNRNFYINVADKHWQSFNSCFCAIKEKEKKKVRDFNVPTGDVGLETHLGIVVVISSKIGSMEYCKNMA